MGNRLVLLGTGTCQLQEHRAASSVLLELGHLRVVFDFGRGIADRLAALGLRQDDIEHVVLSHYHPDHFTDLLPWLHAARWSRIDPRSRDLHVHGPPGLHDTLGRILDVLESSLDRDAPYRVELHETAEDRLTLGGRTFEFVELPPAGNRGLRFTASGRVCALTGDSEYHDREIRFLSGADLAVIDAGHLDDDAIVELAVRSAARRIVCSHLYRELDEPSLLARCRAEGFEGELMVGRDRQTFPL